jgi:regulator of sigma E protease
VTILLFVLTIVVLVGVHELGHFLAARAFGVLVHEFAIGMGPVLVSRKRGETVYSLRLIPIGGYVRMAGEDRLETGDAIPADRILHNKRPYVRALISLTGPVMNFILALVVTLAVAVAISLPVVQVADTVPGAPAAGVLLPGDRVLEMDGRRIHTTADAGRVIEASSGRPVEILVRRGGSEEVLEIAPRRAADRDGYELGVVFSSIAQTRDVASIAVGSPFHAAGIQVGDQIASVGGRETGTGYAVQTAFDRALQAGDVVPITVLRDGASVDLFVRADGRTMSELFEGAALGDHGVEWRRPGLRDGIALGVENFAIYATLLVQGLRDLVSGSAEARESIAGPVGIAAVLGQSWTYGFLYFLQILGILSLNFAIVNLIPFPGLDGSRVVFAVVEWIRGRPIPPQREGLIHAIGFVVILALLVVLTYRDILRLLG